MIRLEIPGRATVELLHVVLDVNGTLTDRGELLDGVEDRISKLKREVRVVLASADTFGTLAAVARGLDVAFEHAADGEVKRELVERLGSAQTAHVGNGSNDVAALGASALGIAVVGREGLSGAAVTVADVVCLSVLDALDLLLEPRALAATLRH